MDTILLITCLFLLAKGIKNLASGQASLWDRDKILANQGIARIVGGLYIVAACGYILYYLFSADHVSLGYHLRHLAGPLLGNGFETLTYWIQDHARDYGQQVFMGAGILGLVINLVAPKKSV